MNELLCRVVSFSTLRFQVSMASICRSISRTDRKDMPIIFVTDHGDVAMTVQAMKAGAFDFPTKPFCDDALLSEVRQAIERSRTAVDHEVEIRGLRDSLHLPQPPRGGGDGARRFRPVE